MEIHTQVFVPPQIYVHPPQQGTRSSSFPYLSGDTFRSISQHVIDELSFPIDVNNINEGDIIFLKTEHLNFFFNIVHPHITCRYILISHNSDLSCPNQYKYMLEDPLMIAWFAQNTDLAYQHPKFFPIPIGLANNHWPHGNTAIIRAAQQKVIDTQKNKLLYLNIASHTNAATRNEVVNLFYGKHYCYCSPVKLWSEYLMDLAGSQFVISPHGNGLDCHRTWETLLMGSFPIVKTSSLDFLYEDLPVLILKDWNEINEEFLTKKYEEFTQTSWHIEKLYAPYWIDKIKEMQPLL